MTRLVVVQGDTAKLRISITNADETAPYDLSPADELIFTIKRSRQDSDAAAIWQGRFTTEEIEIVDPPVDGMVVVTVPKEATVGLRLGQLYPWDLQLEEGEISYTPVHGELLPERPVTHG